MSELVLNANIRTGVTKKPKKIRALGNIPGIFYARGEANINIEVPAPMLKPLIYTSETHIIDLRLNEGGNKRCILRDVQFDPVSDLPIHFDLQGLKENEKLTIEIPVVLIGGTPVGVREGGILQHIIHKIEVSCLPKDIPEKIEIPVGELGMNDFVHIRDISVPNVTILENPDASIVGVMPPTVEKAPEPEAVIEEAPTEPELVGKEKKGDEGAEEEAGDEEKPEKKEKKEKK